MVLLNPKSTFTYCGQLKGWYIIDPKPNVFQVPLLPFPVGGPDRQSSVHRHFEACRTPVNPQAPPTVGGQIGLAKCKGIILS